MILSLKDQLIVSCQALPNEALYGANIMAKMAKAAVNGGAKAIRANSVLDILAIQQEVNVPIIGLIKQDYFDSSIFITPTKKEVLELLHTNCEIIALDATNRIRPNNENLLDLLNLIHESGKLALADIATLEEGINAEKLGFDFVSTTLSGYTEYSINTEKPDFLLVKRLVKKLKIGVIAEGRIKTAKDFLKMKKLKPYAIVIGSAITRPELITRDFVNLLNK